MFNSHYFKPHETECSCCDENNMDQLTMSMLDAARNISGVAFVVTSGARCKKHNAKVGGVHSSAHLSDKEENKYAYAVDIKAEDSRMRFKILQGLIMAGFTRIGISKTFIHADNDKSKSPEVCWLYE